MFLYHAIHGSPSCTRVAVARTDMSEAHLVSDGGPLPPGRRGPWPTGDFDPEFSPDGSHVVWSRVTDTAMNDNLSSSELVRLRTDASDVRRLTPEGDPSAYGIPDWTDGDRIVCMTVDARDNYVGPTVVGANGGDMRRYPHIRGTHFRWIPGR